MSDKSPSQSQSRSAGQGVVWFYAEMAAAVRQGASQMLAGQGIVGTRATDDLLDRAKNKAMEEFNTAGFLDLCEQRRDMVDVYQVGSLCH